MMFNSLIPQPPPNVHRIYVPNFSRTLPKDYPQILHGIIQEGEYVDYLKRIEEALLFSKKFMFVLLIPFIFFIGGIVATVVSKKFYFIAIIAFGFVLFIALTIFVFVKYLSKVKKALEKLNEVLTEINTRFYPRGVKWTYNAIHVGRSSSIQFFDIITFAPGANDAPPMDGAIFQSPHYSVAPGANAYPAPSTSYPSAPPPPTQSYPGDPSNTSNPYGY